MLRPMSSTEQSKTEFMALLYEINRQVLLLHGACSSEKERRLCDKMFDCLEKIRVARIGVYDGRT